MEAVPVVPILSAEEPAPEIAISRAVLFADLAALNIAFRTDRTVQCGNAVSKEVSKALPGTRTSAICIRAKQAIDFGVMFVVPLDLDVVVVKSCQMVEIPVRPSNYTPLDVLRACNIGLDVVQFLPGPVDDGINAIGTVATPFHTIRLILTGSTSASNLAGFSTAPSVLARAGSWLLPTLAIAKRDIQAILRLPKKSFPIARQARTLKKR